MSEVTTPTRDELRAAWPDEFLRCDATHEPRPLTCGFCALRAALAHADALAAEVESLRADKARLETAANKLLNDWAHKPIAPVIDFLKQVVAARKEPA